MVSNDMKTIIAACKNLSLKEATEIVILLQDTSFGEALREVLNKKGVELQPETPSYRSVLKNFFMSMGAYPNIKGFDYLIEATLKAYDDRDYLHSITKSLYPELAKKFKVTPNKVERNIRHAIEILYGRGLIQKVGRFGMVLTPGTGASSWKASNGVFLALVVDWLDDNWSDKDQAV